jgi:hypothetical protein
MRPAWYAIPRLSMTGNCARRPPLISEVLIPFENMCFADGYNPIETEYGPSPD